LQWKLVACFYKAESIINLQKQILVAIMCSPCPRTTSHTHSKGNETIFVARIVSGTAPISESAILASTT
jgi:hypothetical protein